MRSLVTAVLTLANLSVLLTRSLGVRVLDTTALKQKVIHEAAEAGLCVRPFHFWSSQKSSTWEVHFPRWSCLTSSASTSPARRASSFDRLLPSRRLSSRPPGKGQSRTRGTHTTGTAKDVAPHGPSHKLGKATRGARQHAGQDHTQEGNTRDKATRAAQTRQSLTLGTAVRGERHS